MAKFNRLIGKHIVVLGGSGGIGRAIVEAAIESGARLTLVGSSQKTADAAVSSVKAEYPKAQLVGLGCDLSQPTIEQDLDALLTRAAQPSGEIDHIILTAGERVPYVGLQDITSDDVFKAAHMRFLVPLMVGKVAQRHLTGATNGMPGDGKNKSLTFTSGTIATKPIPNFAIGTYVAAGLNGMMRNLALDLSPIRVNAVEPGPVNTPLWDAAFAGSGTSRDDGLQKMFSRLPVGKAATTEEVAEAYMYLLRDTNATGEVVKTGGGSHLI
ncbi:short-chain dehydrogenase [Xylaria intraflava]|nr:short-chain dehydrogenase [Xylaria intraflava]